MAGTIRHKAQARDRQVTPIDFGFSAWATVPLLDLRDERDAVVVKDMFELALGSRVEVRVIRVGTVGWRLRDRRRWLVRFQDLRGGWECIL
jgi:hypothetical protein